MNPCQFTILLDMPDLVRDIRDPATIVLDEAASISCPLGSDPGY